MEKYDHRAIEEKWQKIWAEDGVFAAGQQGGTYVLDMFPYPSGDGLHVGHPEGYTATDIYSRYLRMNGTNVLHPMGWDAFGLPAENAAIKKGIHPADVTAKNIANFKRQIQSLGFSYDWDREVNTTDPAYYKWTQWIFLQLFKRGLAYEKEAPIWWCPKDKTGLANEEVVNGCCERCGTAVEKKMLKQWMLKITAYADRLLDGLEKLEWPEGIKALQRNWIGKSEGAEVQFSVSQDEKPVAVLVHGSPVEKQDEMQSVKHWFPHVRRELEQLGYEVVTPEMPEPHLPEYSAWKKEFEKSLQKKVLDERSIVVGHSAGGAFVARYLTEKELTVGWLGLVAAAKKPSEGSDERSQATRALYDFEVGNKISRNSIVIISDNDDSRHIQSADYYVEHLQAEKKLVHGKGHFRKKEGATELPEFTDWIKEQLAVTVFTTRPDTLFGATYLVLSPEHELVDSITTKEQSKAVAKYKKEVAAKSDLERTSLEKEKTGVFTGAYAINPVNNEKIPVWIADYVLSSYGTGAIMAVPAHDERDFAFAKKFGLPILNVVRPAESPFTLLIHGITGHSKENWFPWFKANIEGIGWNVAIPDMPDSAHPTVKKWNSALQKYNESVSSDSVLVGHSLGAPAVLHYLQSLGKKVQKVILVAPTSPVPDWNKFSTEVPEVDWKFADEFNKEIVFDWDRINRLANEFIVYCSDNDPYIEKVNIDFYKKHLPKADFRLIKGRYHFNEYYGIKDFPELLHDFSQCWNGEGILIGSGEFNGLESAIAREKIVAALQSKGLAQPKVQYKLRDWVFSRQRYWGEPIPLVHCEKCGVVPVPEDQLPLELPKVDKYEPTGTGESPLAGIEEWVNTTCPNCGGKAKRETNTMPQWAGSCWYYLRFTDPNNDKAFASAEAMKEWLPVDVYVGGAEHAVLHLLYSRFWHKVLFDAGFIPPEVGDEPFMKLKNQGLILGPDGEKMSKSRGNVINPDEIVEKFGADTLRMYEMFMGPFEDAKPWDTNGIIGVRRFLDKVWRAAERVEDVPANDRWHKYAMQITEGIQQFRLNTCVSDFMKWTNDFGGAPVSKEEFGVFLKLLSPFAPHIAEELWSQLGHTTILAQESWPKFDPKKVKDETVTIAVQVMGKLRATIALASGTSQTEVEQAAKAEPNVQKYLNSEPKKVIFVKDKLINFVV